MFVWLSSPGSGTGGEMFYPDYLVVSNDFSFRHSVLKRHLTCAKSKRFAPLYSASRPGLVGITLTSLVDPSAVIKMRLAVIARRRWASRHSVIRHRGLTPSKTRTLWVRHPDSLYRIISALRAVVEPMTQYTSPVADPRSAKGPCPRTHDLFKGLY